MIRRNTTDPRGTLSWILISQVAHARLAAELAQAWSRPLVELADVNRELLDTIEHHDDGWSVWELSPRVDQPTGRPLQFTEMPLDQALEIWQRSIDACGQIGELAAWLVAGHFSALLRHSNAWQKTDHPRSATAHEFLQRQDANRVAWLRGWQSVDPRRRAWAVAERALRWLQFFDALSLWLCCAERSAAEQLDCVEPATLTLAPRDAQCIVVSPWPFGVPSVDVSLAGQRISAARYTDADLVGPQGAEVRLAWRLERESNGSRCH